VHGETTVSYGRIAPIPPPISSRAATTPFSPFLCHRQAKVLRAPWPAHSGKDLSLLCVVLAARCAQDTHRGNRLVNSAMIERERELEVTVSTVHVGRPFSRCLSQIDECP
jgi:hypothetical protein